MEVEETTDTGRSTVVKWALIVGIFVVVAAAVGSIGHLSGAGFFGYRTFLYGEGELYALNMGAEPLWISVDGRERAEVPGHNAKVVDLVGGTSTVTVTNGAGEVIDTHHVTIDDSHAFLKLTDEGCVAVVDVTPFYGGQQRGMLDFEAFLRNPERVWIPHSQNDLWPRKEFPSKLAGGDGKGLWFEIVACELFDEPEFLDAYLATRVEQRMARALGKDSASK